MENKEQIPASAGIRANTGIIPEKISCPKCKKGIILKGKTAYGCSEYKNDCDFIYSFEDIRKKAAGKAITKELVYQILNGRN